MDSLRSSLPNKPHSQRFGNSLQRTQEDSLVFCLCFDLPLVVVLLHSQRDGKFRPGLLCFLEEAEGEGRREERKFGRTKTLAFILLYSNTWLPSPVTTSSNPNPSSCYKIVGGGGVHIGWVDVEVRRVGRNSDNELILALSILARLFLQSPGASSELYGQSV